MPVQEASLDHSVWLHEDARADEWLLYSMDSPWTGHARGLNRGQIFSRDGKLVASTAQEGLISARHGSVIGYVRADETMRPGVVSMAHCWGATGEYPFFLNGAHTGRLVSLTQDVQSINRMPLQSGIPVTIERLNFCYESALNGAVPIAMAIA